MLKNSVVLVVFLFLASVFINAQEIGTWQSYSSKKEIVALASINDNLIWCATSGGAYMYEASSSSFLQLGTSDGLASPLLTSIAIDKLNQVWFGTQLGAEPGMLNVYNSESGIVRKVNDIFNSDFTQKNINSLTTSGDTVLVATAFGLSLINPNNFSFYDTFIKFGEFQAAVPVISAVKYNRFFVLTDNGVAVQKNNSTNLSAPEAWDTYFFNNDITSDKGYEFVEYNGNVLLATNDGVFKFLNKSWEIFLLPSIEVNDIFSVSNSLYVSATESGKNVLYEYTGGNLSLVFENPEEYEITDVIVSSNGIIYVATKAGLLKIESGSSNLINPDGPENNSFLSLDTDSDGNLWVGTGQDAFGIGIMKFDGVSWELLSNKTNSDIITNAYHNVFVGSDNTKYFCNWGRGLTVLKNGVVTNYNAQNTDIAGISDDPSFLVITDVKVDSKGNIWVLNLQSANLTPLSVITTSGQTHNLEFTSPQINESELAFDLEIDQFDTKWFTITVGDVGLYYFNENGTYNTTTDDDMRIIKQNNGLLSNSVTSLALDKFGSLWVGTNIGISIIPDPSRPTERITTVNALRQQTINDIEVDALNQKWVATVKGLFHLSQDGTVVINSYNSENSPLPSDDIKSVTVDGTNGIVYIGTDFGLTALKTTSVAASENMDALFVYPNPLIINNSDNQQITIQGLISDTSIKVLNVSGELIREFETPGGSVAFWDAKNEDGNFVPSGVYLIVAYDEDGSNVATAKVAVLQK